MGIYELIREQKIQGRVADKYRLENGNLGLIIEEESGQRYSVELQTRSAKPCLANLYGLIDEPFKGKDEYLDRLIKEGDQIDLRVGYRQGPLKIGYGLRSVSSGPERAYAGEPRPPQLAYQPGGHY